MSLGRLFQEAIKIRAGYWFVRLRLTTWVMAQDFLSIIAGSQKRVTQFISRSVRSGCARHYAINNFCFAGIVDGFQYTSNDVLFRWQRFGGEIDGAGDFSIAP